FARNARVPRSLEGRQFGDRDRSGQLAIVLDALSLLEQTRSGNVDAVARSTGDAAHPDTLSVRREVSGPRIDRRPEKDVRVHPDVFAVPTEVAVTETGLDRHG